MSTELYMEYTHNHTITSLQALSFRDISEQTKKNVWKLFDDGLSPGLAYFQFLKQLKDICQELDHPDLVYMKKKQIDPSPLDAQTSTGLCLTLFL